MRGSLTGTSQHHNTPQQCCALFRPGLAGGWLDNATTKGVRLLPSRPDLLRSTERPDAVAAFGPNPFSSNPDLRLAIVGLTSQNLWADHKPGMTISGAAAHRHPSNPRLGSGAAAGVDRRVCALPHSQTPERPPTDSPADQAIK